MSIEMAGPVAFLSGSESAVFFSKSGASAGTFQANASGTVPLVKKMQTALEVAFWGEDNRFPQNIEQQMSYCSIGKAALNWKAAELWGAGIIPGKITGYENGGKDEIFEPLNRDQHKPVYKFVEDRRMFRFWLEYLQDWTWYSNCFPEVIFSKDAKTITGLVHQESCDSRFKQMNDEGQMEYVYISKLWGAARDQFAKFDPAKAMRGLVENPTRITEVDNKFVKALDCIDMYDPVNSAKKIGEKLKASRKPADFKSAILPVNYPSVNKTYYQVPAWDGARLSGWVEIACKIPSLIKTLYNKAFRIKYHIEVPETYFERKYGFEKWHSMLEEEQNKARKKLLKEMDTFLSGDENAFKSFISFFDTDPTTKVAYGQIKISELPDKTNIDKELITQSAADIEILIAMEVPLPLFSYGTSGSGIGGGNGSGSDIREAKLTYDSRLTLERNVLLEPLYLVSNYNREVGGMSEWAEDIVFRFRDTVLTTLDKGKGTEKVVS